MSECSYCKQPVRTNCRGGDLEYLDGSSRVCPEWNRQLDIIGGMTLEEADDQARFDAVCR